MAVSFSRPLSLLLDGIPVQVWNFSEMTPPGVISNGALEWRLVEGGGHQFLGIKIDGLEIRIYILSGLCDLHADWNYVFPNELNDTVGDPLDDEDQTAAYGDNQSDDPTDALLDDEDQRAIHAVGVADAHTPWSTVLGHITVAGAALSALCDIDIDEGVRDEAVLVLTSLSDHVTAGCLRAFADGHLIVHARPNSLLAPYIPLPADAWQHLEIRDWAAGRLKGHTGETFYSARVVVAGHGPPSAIAPSKGSALVECRKRLTEIVTASLNRRTESKSSLRKKLVSEIDGLSGRGFNSAWDQTIERLGASKWTQPGAIGKDKP